MCACVCSVSNLVCVKNKEGGNTEKRRVQRVEQRERGKLRTLRRLWLAVSSSVFIKM